MTKTTPYYVTYQSYDERGRRLAIFGRVVYTNQMEIFILKCSVKDSFFKKKARGVYQKWLEVSPDLKQIVDLKYHPQVYLLPLEDTTRTRKRFNEHVHENYCKLGLAMDMIITDVLYNAEGKEVKRLGRNKTAELAMMEEYVTIDVDDDYDPFV